MSTTPDIAGHYTSGDLLARLEARLRADGIDPARPTFEALAPYDHFHGRGIEATEELVAGLDVSPTDHLLDVGSGIGGPARYFAKRFDCRVSGIDLTAEFCEVARHLTAQLGLSDHVSFEQGDALAMPFNDAAFDGAYTMNVSMNIRDKRAFFREISRVLKPGACSDCPRSRRGQVAHPTTLRPGPKLPRRAFWQPPPKPTPILKPRDSRSRAAVTRRKPHLPTPPARVQWSMRADSLRTAPSCWSMGHLPKRRWRTPGEP